MARTAGEMGRGPSATTLIGPLAMLVGGALTGALLWHFLMREPAPRRTRGEGGAGVERLSQHDRQALDHVLQDQAPQP